MIDNLEAKTLERRDALVQSLDTSDIVSNSKRQPDTDSRSVDSRLLDSTAVVPVLPSSLGATESRYDPISGEWTIFAPHRSNRPDQFGSMKRVATQGAIDCPFCSGNEHATPQASWAASIDADDQFHVFDDPDGIDAIDWTARVVPNKYPVVAHRSSEASSRNGEKPRATSLFQSRQIAGAHEVIIESPNHVQSISELDLSETRLLLFAYQERLRYWRNQEGVKYISLFKNVGGDAGASLQHSHSQLIAMDQIPSSVANICERMRTHQAKTGCCLQCDLVRAEQKLKTRIVAQTDSLVAYCPYASRLPMMIRVTSKQHLDNFDDLPMESVDELARLLQRMTRWLEAIVPGAAYNVLLHSRPPGEKGSHEAFHWSLEFFPRISRIAGFEWSSECMISTVLPEIAADRYRQLATAEDPRHVFESIKY